MASRPALGYSRQGACVPVLMIAEGYAIPVKNDPRREERLIQKNDPQSSERGCDKNKIRGSRTANKTAWSAKSSKMFMIMTSFNQGRTGSPCGCVCVRKEKTHAKTRRARDGSKRRDACVQSATCVHMLTHVDGNKVNVGKSERIWNLERNANQRQLHLITDTFSLFSHSC